MQRLWIVCAVVAMGTLASAQPAPFVASEATCGHPEGSEIGLACAAYYLDAYNKNPAASAGDRALYNAGVSYLAGGATSPALSMFAMVRKYYPNSRIAKPALARIAKITGDLAFYDRAAVALEEYSKRYAGEKDAPDAMTDAIVYRTALRQFDKAIDDSNYFIKTYGAKSPAVAADAAWARIGIYDAAGDRDAVIKSTRQYINTQGNHGGAARLVIAYARIGEGMAENSCPVPLTEGLCVKNERVRAKGTCSEAVETTRIARRTKAVEEAFAAFRSAQMLFEKGGGKFDDSRYEGAARSAYGRSLIVIASLEMEETALSVLVAATPDERRTVEYIKAGHDGFARLESAVGPITALNDPTSSVAALLLRAQYLEAQASSLERGLCAKTKDAAKNLNVDVLRQATGYAYERCASASVNLKYPDGSLACIRGIERTVPDIHVPFRELVNHEPKSGLVTVLER